MRAGSREHLLRGEGGFTLTEMLVTMIMMITVLFALYGIFDMSIRVFSYGNDKTEAVENARVGLEKMERELRAAYPQSSGVLLNTWNSNQITFQNKPSSGSPTTIAYQLSSGSPPALLRNGAAVVEYVNGTSGLNFTYFTKTGSTPTSESEVARVRITLKIKVPGLQSGTQTLTTDVGLRNR